MGAEQQRYSINQNSVAVVRGIFACRVHNAWNLNIQTHFHLDPEIRLNLTDRERGSSIAKLIF